MFQKKVFEKKAAPIGAILCRPHGVPSPPLGPPPKHLVAPMQVMTNEQAQSVVGGMMDECIDALVIRVDNVDIEAVRSIDGLDLTEAVQGIYWLIAFHNDKPIYKQEPSDPDALLLWWQIGPEGGWYITDHLFDKNSKQHKMAVTSVDGNNYKQPSGASHTNNIQHNSFDHNNQ